MKKGRDSTHNLGVNKSFKLIDNTSSNVGFVYNNGRSDLKKPETTATICNYLRTSPLPTSPPREFLFKPCHFCGPLESWVPDTPPKLENENILIPVELPSSASGVHSRFKLIVCCNVTMPSGILGYVFGKSVSIQVSPLSYLLILATTKVEQSDVVLLCNMSKQYLTLQLIKIPMLHHVTA